MKQRSPRVLLGVWLGMALATVPASAAEVPVVRFVEVGDSGVVFEGVALRATLEVTTTEAFRGTLVLTYRWTQDASWSERAWGVHWGDLARVPIDLKPGTTRVDVEVPSPCDVSNRRGQQTLFEAVWGLENADGERLASGRQAAHPETGMSLRILRITAEPGEGFRRAPDLAWEVPARYEPYAIVLVSRDDLLGLRGRQRLALFDAVALGLTLAVTPPGGADVFAPLGPPFDEVLGNERIVWKGDAGEEIREASLLWGRIRRTTLAAPASTKGADDASLVPWMLLTAPRSRPDGGLFAFVPEEGRYSQSLPERARSARLGALSAYAVVTSVLVLLFLGSRRYGRPPRLPVAVAIAACLASPTLLYVALANARAGNSDWRFRVTVNDGISPVACTGSYESQGGGGGSRPVALSSMTSRRGIVVLASNRRLTVAPVGEKAVRATALNNDVAPLMVTVAFSRSLVPPDPLWEAAVHWEDGHLAGTLRARRDVKDAWILGLRGRDRRHIGAVTAGGRIDVSSFPPIRVRPEREDRGELQRPLMGYIGTWYFEVPRTYWPIPDFSPSFVVSEEWTAGDDTAVYDYQSLRPVGAPEDAIVELPAFLRDSSIHVAIPKVCPLPRDALFFMSAYPWVDGAPSRAARLEEAPGGIRRAIVENRGRFLETWERLRPDLPKGTGYVAARSKKGT